MFHGRCFCILLLQYQLIYPSLGSNLTKFLELRQKRSLIYEGGGSIKFSVSGSWPFDLGDRVNWRQMNCIVSISTQYKLPDKPLNSWELSYGKSLKSGREEFDRTGYYKADSSRIFTYAALEEYMNRNGRNGRQCLLRSICENAQIDEHVDVYSRILDVVLTPQKDALDDVYYNAVAAGRFGADCLSSYPKCPYGESFLDQFANVT